MPIKTTYLKDYSAPDFYVEKIHLTFELEEERTRVISQLVMVKNLNKEIAAETLILQGENVELVSIKLNDKLLLASDYKADDKQLSFKPKSEHFTVEIVTYISPKNNTALHGLYMSRDMFCTQCEAEGFRRITYFLDRPDVLSRYTTTLIADKTHYPILLSNGNPIAQGTLTENRHWVTWEDPFKKPCYLFALVAGDLEFIEDFFITASNRKVTLRIFAERGQSNYCLYAMDALKKAMRWDEHAYGREYDLDIFMIVAIHDFNSGAMENKGLNLFNAKYILANPETVTDNDYEHILSVVGHEYFHNWTGNRITCRDWFQLSLKEGLTVFREQEFMADTMASVVIRIKEVDYLRQMQFLEDSGPLAHPVQPDSYIAINNFYTMTVYEKGAEIIRMLKVLLGEVDFRRGMDIYFSRYDGQAVTIENFISSMEAASSRDLTQFKAWYHQAGTPELKIATHYDDATASLILTVQQHCLLASKKNITFHLPLSIGLLTYSGKEIPLRLAGQDNMLTTGLLEIKEPIEEFTFINVPEKPVISLLRNFSAPVKIVYDYSDEELFFLSKYDTDHFNRWEFGQQLACRLIFKIIAGADPDIQVILNLFKYLLMEVQSDKLFIAELLILPSEDYLATQMPIIDVDGLYKARCSLRQRLAEALRSLFLQQYHANALITSYRDEAEAIGSRRLKNTCLAYLMLLNDTEAYTLCKQQFDSADNMTDRLSALRLLADHDTKEREHYLNNFYERWKTHVLIVDKWLAIQAYCELPNNLQRVKALLQHPAFDIKNPNKVRSLIGAFTHNTVQFHDKSGSGYSFLTEQVLTIDRLNPQVAAHLLVSMTQWRHYDEIRQQLMRRHIEQIINTAQLSKNVYEIAVKSL